MARGVPSALGKIRAEISERKIQERTVPIVTYQCGCVKSKKRRVDAPVDGLIPTALLCAYCENTVKPTIEYPVNF